MTGTQGIPVGLRLVTIAAFAARRLAPVAAAVLLGLLLVAPVVALGIVGRDAIGGELAQQATSERIRTVRLGAAFLARPIDNAGDQLSVFAARPAPRAAYARRSAA